MAQYRDIKINLLERDTKKEEKIRKNVISVMVIFALFAGMGFMYISAQNRLVKVKAENEQIKAKFIDSQTILQQITCNNDSSNLIEHKLGIVKEIENTRISLLSVLNEIEVIIPPGITICEMEFDADKSIITGYACDHTEYAIFVSGMSESKFFNNIQVYSSMGNIDTGDIQFTIEMDWGDRK